MDNIAVVEHFISFAELLQEKPYFFLRQVIFVVKNVLLEVALVAVLHDNVEILLTRYLNFNTVD